ncbi:alpha/beta-hydrolase [Cylindrobasidium torrendii FP15055 ss-10]|uniref:Alpha/beta-hydrolase n=1 Tax=Cylindrobasidium torrendii FP15055 ss-10 TaxID=1314674 RepID=A0A0D7BT47_9AGAR|nr:alpha/beta-hydrolase [Cylindrobasidium torrendii FP15055 ss-10]
MSNAPVRSNVECGSVIVPKDYFNASAGTSSIAFARQRAIGKSKGLVFLNPGGPGIPGTRMVLNPDLLFGEDRLIKAIGSDWDLIGFDTRGVGFSRPATNCFANPKDLDLFHANTVVERGLTISSLRNFSAPVAKQELVWQYKEFLALKQSQAAICAQAMGDELRYMGTSTIVRDIAFMTDVLDGPDAKINYFGSSYGSILGSYLVNMFPERIGYAVIDGVVEPSAWADKPNYKWPHDWLEDAEAAYRTFLQDCAKAGPARCALAQFDGQPWEYIQERLDIYFDELSEKPLPMPFGVRPGYLTSGGARSILFIALEVPRAWPRFAAMFGSAMFGNATDLYRMAVLQGGVHYDRLAISCADSTVPYSLEDYPKAEDLADEVIRTMQDTTMRFGSTAEYGEGDGGCQYWPYRSPGRFTGPWNATLDTPMLIISNTHDPITPKASGLRVNSNMPDSSVVLVQNSPGHTSHSVSSVCTETVIHHYFQGVIPKNGTTCDVDDETFPLPGSPFYFPDEAVESSLRMRR